MWNHVQILIFVARYWIAQIDFLELLKMQTILNHFIQFSNVLKKTFLFVNKFEILFGFLKVNEKYYCFLF